MKDLHFYDGMKKLSDYFGKKTTDDQNEFYFDELSYISEFDFDRAIKVLIRNRKPIPRFFPTIEDIQNLCRKKTQTTEYNPEETEIQYYRRIKVDHLWVALKTLKTKGHEDFLKYSQTMNFNDEDIERVENKNRMKRFKKHEIGQG